MKRGPLVQHVNKTSAKSRGTMTTILLSKSRARSNRSKNMVSIASGTVNQEQKYGEYRLVRRVRLMRRGESVRRKGSLPPRHGQANTVLISKPCRCRSSSLAVQGKECHNLLEYQTLIKPFMED